MLEWHSACVVAFCHKSDLHPLLTYGFQNRVRQSLIMQDFGKALARYVTVFNCSAGVDLRTTGRILAGLAQTGAWACLEELSRVPVDVLSIVAAQIGSLMQVGDFGPLKGCSCAYALRPASVSIVHLFEVFSHCHAGCDRAQEPFQLHGEGH